KLSVALANNCPSGFCGLPERLRGACASSASRIADSAIAVGAKTVDVPVNGCNGGKAGSDGRASGGVGEKRPRPKPPAPAENATASSPNKTVRMRMALGCQGGPDWPQ